MDAFTREYFRMRPHYTQHLLWTIEMQGQRIELKQSLTDYKIPDRPKRNPCCAFTRRARMRMLKFVAGVDWPAEAAGQFITLTYPDSVVARKNVDITNHREVFHRYMEKHLCRQVSLLWRVEWKPRLSGIFQGQFAPHYHLIVFGKAALQESTVLKYWQRSLGVKEWVSVDSQRLTEGKRASIYVSKYCAKMPESQSLDKVSYLHKPGRHWGYTRKPGIPLKPIVKFIDLSWQCVADLERMQRTYNDHYDVNKDAGFTMLGNRAEEWRQAILEACLADGAVPVYTDCTKGEQSSPIP